MNGVVRCIPAVTLRSGSCLTKTCATGRVHPVIRSLVLKDDARYSMILLIPHENFVTNHSSPGWLRHSLSQPLSSDECPSYAKHPVGVIVGGMLEGARLVHSVPDGHK